MTSNGTDTFLVTTYKVGGSMFHNYIDALVHSIMESDRTSAGSDIIVEQHYEF